MVAHSIESPVLTQQSPHHHKETAKMFVSLEGQTLGKYRLMEPLGKGGMAQVYRAFHPQLERYVAIKVLRSDLVKETEFLARFQREARAVAGLRHPNIVQVHDFDIHENVYYMVMELLEGDTLKAYENAFRAQGERMSWGEMLRILLDILEGLQYAHDENIVHRDLKPANIMLTRKGQAVITDFGVAQIIGGIQHTVPGALFGTLAYMAPEQGMEGITSPRSDIYSLGVVFYEMLTGTPPFEADTPLAILMKHLNDPLPLPRKLDPNIPEALERILLKALAKQPAERYQSAREMASALQSAAEEMGEALPQKLSLPDTLAGAGSGTVGIFSGPAKDAIRAGEFAKDDTEAFEPPEALINELVADPDIQSGINFFVKFKDSLLTKTTLKTGPAVVMGLGILLFVNLCNITFAAFFQNWNVYVYGWPVNIILLGAFFFLLMYPTARAWFSIPGILLTGTGLLMTYFSFSGNWEQWVFLWPMQMVIILTAVIAFIFIARFGKQMPGLVCLVGGVMSGIALLAALVLNLISFVLPLELIQRFF